jgi:hypothetical protein
MGLLPHEAELITVTPDIPEYMWWEACRIRGLLLQHLEWSLLRRRANWALEAPGQDP